jgi:hypothetical protein
MILQQCSSTSPSCACTFCTINFHCPFCTRKPHVHAKCRLESELAAKADAERRAALRIAKDVEERGYADELAGAMNEFFEHLCVTPLAGGLDTITVTTEFGVMEEGGNSTVISAGAGGWGEMDVEMTEDVDGGIGVETMMDVSDDDANGDGEGDGDGDVDTDADAETAFIDEFMHAEQAD